MYSLMVACVVALIFSQTLGARAVGIGKPVAYATSATEKMASLQWWRASEVNSKIACV